MNHQQQARKLAEMYTEIAENEGAYFEGGNVNSSWYRAEGSPYMGSDLALWRVHIPPKKQVIDLSVLIESGID